MSTQSFALRSVAALVLLGSLASGTTYYVDVTIGSDANSGTSPNTAWKTLTHAMASGLVGSQDFVHVAAGTYTASSGEVFPIFIPPVAGIVGASADTTIFDGQDAAGTMLQPGTGNPPSSPGVSIERLTLRNAEFGVWMDAYAHNGSLSMTDCTVSGFHQRGVLVNSHAFAHVQVNIDRCRITGNRGVGLSIGSSNGAFTSALVSDSLVADGQGTGVVAVASPGDPSASGVSLVFQNCTIADNRSYGIFSAPWGGFAANLTMNNSIVFGNGQDVHSEGITHISHSLVGVDPRFVDPDHDDYRLSWRSPAIDTGDSSQRGTTDLLRHARSIDGDLDTSVSPDIGAFEFEPLHRFGGTSIDTDVAFELWGSNGSTAQVFFSNAALNHGSSTPFGALYLGGSVVNLGSVVAGSGPPGLLIRHIPNDSALIGTTLSFQALTDSALAPQGKAYTNATSFVVLP